MQNHSTLVTTEKSTTTFFKLFWAAYFFVYAFPFPLDYIPFLSTLSRWYYQCVAKVVVWTGIHLYHVSADLLLHSDGSSDSTFNYIRLSLFIVPAIAIAISGLVYKPRKDILSRLVTAAEIYIRYYLAFTLLRYGSDKIIKAQFPFPYYNLNETYGESSPLRLFKSFMGYSLWYNVFLGVSEAAAALLLLFRKTKLFGALLSVVILTNIVVMNFTFDLSVKMVSLILLAMSVFVMLSDNKLLIKFYHQYKLYSKTWSKRFEKGSQWTISRRILLVAVAVCICYSIITRTWHVYQTSGDGAFNKQTLSGVYNTRLFVRNGDTLLPLLTDATQWKALTLGNGKQANLKLMNDSTKYCRFEADTTAKTIFIRDKEDTTYQSRLTYSLPDPAHLILKGRIKDDSVYLLMQKQDYNDYRLINRGFHWINEYPYAR